MKICFMLMFIAYCNCIVVKTPNDSEGASEYWKAKARETEVDTAYSIIVPSVIFGVIFGIPIVGGIIAAFIIGLMWIVGKICEICKKKKNTNEKVEDGF